MALTSHSKRLIINRTSVSSLKSVFSRKTKNNIRTSFPLPSPTLAPSQATSFSPSTCLFSPFSRSRGVLASVQSMLPLHSAVADARLTSCLSSSSPGSRSLSQELGLSGPR